MSGTIAFSRTLPVDRGVLLAGTPGASDDETQTSAVFSEKWTTLRQDQDDQEEGWKANQFLWYLDCYGYDDEAGLAKALKSCRTILDAGCGPGYKAAWLARLAPHATVVAMDLSESIFVASRRYADQPNLMFVRGDIAATPFEDAQFDLISCDQVLHHTDSPPDTLREFRRILAPDGTLNTYVYAFKALPRELLDGHMRSHAKAMSNDELWALSEQMTALGKMLSDLDLTLDFPDIPAFGIKGGKQDLQRFIYWNFLKCYWNADAGHDASTMINYDWYSPSTAYRYTRGEFETMMEAAGFSPLFLHSEEACHTGRFRK